MTRIEERELIERLRKGDEKAREELIIKTMRFAKYIAKDYLKPGAFFDFDDLLQECNIALIRAVDYIKKTGLKGSTRFISYANKVMRNHLRKNLKVQSYTIKHSQHFKFNGVIDKLMGAIAHKYDNAMGEGMHGGFNFVIPEDYTPGKSALNKMLIDIMDEFLTLEEEDITKLRFGFGHKYFDTPDWQRPNKPLTREKVAKILNCSIKRVKVHEEKAMKKLQTDEVKFKLLPWI